MTSFDAQAFLWDYRASRSGPDHYDPFIALFPRHCDRLLDAGCGAGRLTVLLADRARSVIGIDFSQAMLTLAQERSAAADVRHIAWLRGNLYDLPFAASTFDCVMATSVLHLVDQDRALPELKRVVSPGGRLLLWDWRTSAHDSRVTPYHYWYALRASVRALARYGAGAAWQVAAIPWRACIAVRRAASARRPTQAPIDEAFSRYLPGWQLAQAPGTLVLWEKP
jgi:SAM-dependent methyltransferase